MSLRRRLFLLLGGLVCLLLVGQWLLFRALTRAVTDDVRTVAIRVGEEILSGFAYRTEDGASAAAGAPTGAAGQESTPPGQEEAETHVVILTSEPPPGENGEPDAQQGPRTFRREFHFNRAVPAPQRGDAVGEGTLRKMVLETDAARDVLFVRGPASARAIPIPHAALATTLDRFGSRLLLGNLVLLGVGLAGAAVVAHRLTRPLAGLSEAAERLGGGELGAEVEVERDDEIGRAIAAFNRMSQRLALLDRENRRLASVEQLSELGEVARGLAHSLRNPLNALGLAIDQLESRGELVEGSQRQIRRMDGALRSFLALASAGAAQVERVDLTQLAREVALEALQDGRGRVRLEVEAEAPAAGTADLTVDGVPAELKAVLQALVVNAVEASPAAGQVTIRIDRVAEGGLRLTVDDQGAGLPAEVRDRLFQPHVTTKSHGSGMGLFLAHRLVTGRYGGALGLAARPAGGTRATVELGPRRVDPGTDPTSGRESGR